MTRIEGAQITREQFLLREMRIACQLHMEGFTDDAVKIFTPEKACEHIENIFKE